MGDGVPQVAAHGGGEGPSGRYGVETVFEQRMKETWGGLTLSRRLSERLGLGATVFGVHRGQRARWDQSLQIAYPDGSGVSAAIVDHYDYYHWRMLAKVGLAWEDRTTRLGLVVTSPSAGLYGKGKAGFTRAAMGADLDADGAPDG